MSNEKLQNNDNNIEEIENQKSQKEIIDSIVNEKGIVADKFDESPPINATAKQLDKFKDKKGVNVTYNFNADELERALKIFQKYTIYKKNIIYSLLIGLLFITYLIRIGTGKTQGTFDIFICAICIVVVGMIWYYPINHIKIMVKTVRESPIEDFNMTVYDDALVLGKEESATIIEYNSGYLRVWETDELFVIGYEKQRIFLLPKRCLSDTDEINSVSQYFKNGLGNKYFRL